MQEPPESQNRDGTTGEPAVAAASEGTAQGGPARRTARQALRLWYQKGMRAVMGRIMGPMLTCRELIDFLWRYVEEDLTPDERKTFDRHLAMCRSCRAYLASYRKTIELGRVAFPNLDAEVPGDVPEEIVQGILAARRAQG